MLDFNNAGLQVESGFQANDLALIKADLNDRIEDVLYYLLPGGRVNGKEYEAADKFGGIGRSLKVRMTGEKRGVWSDFANEDGGSDLIALWKLQPHRKQPVFAGVPI